MAIERWTPTTRTTQQEEFILKRCRKKRKLFVFLRENREETNHREETTRWQIG